MPEPAGKALISAPRASTPANRTAFRSAPDHRRTGSARSAAKGCGRLFSAGVAAGALPQQQHHGGDRGDTEGQHPGQDQPAQRAGRPRSSRAARSGHLRSNLPTSPSKRYGDDRTQGRQQRDGVSKTVVAIEMQCDERGIASDKSREFERKLEGGGRATSFSSSGAPCESSAIAPPIVGEPARIGIGPDMSSSAESPRLMLGTISKLMFAPARN